MGKGSDGGGGDEGRVMIIGASAEPITSSVRNTTVLVDFAMELPSSNRNSIFSSVLSVVPYTMIE